VTLSHEVLEQLADPLVQQCVVVTFPPPKPHKPPHGPHHMGDDRGRAQKAAVAYETADPVEGDEYTIDGVPVSNFVTKAWFQDATNPVGPFDYLKKLAAPLSLTAGGYVAFSRNLESWEQYTADARPAVHNPFRRRHRRSRQKVR
jgi:hypothetical protein